MDPCVALFSKHKSPDHGMVALLANGSLLLVCDLGFEFRLQTPSNRPTCHPLEKGESCSSLACQEHSCLRGVDRCFRASGGSRGGGGGRGAIVPPSP